MVNENNKFVPTTPKTYEQFVLDNQFEKDQKVANSYTAELDAYNDISIVKGYGPSSSGGIDYELHITGSCPDHLLGIVAQKHKAHWEKLIIRLRDGNFWYYTNDPTSGVGGDSSWWSHCNLFTSAIEAGGGGVEQWRTREMRMSSPEAAQKTKIALTNEEYLGKKIIVLNGWGFDTDNAKAKKNRTINIIDENLSMWRNRNEFTLIDKDISI